MDHHILRDATERVVSYAKQRIIDEDILRSATAAIERAASDADAAYYTTPTSLTLMLMKVVRKYFDQQRRANIHMFLTTCGNGRMTYLGNRRCPHCDGYHDAEEAISKALLNS